MTLAQLLCSGLSLLIAFLLMLGFMLCVRLSGKGRTP